MVMLLRTSPILTRCPCFISTSFICPVIYSINRNRVATMTLNGHDTKMWELTCSQRCSQTGKDKCCVFLLVCGIFRSQAHRNRVERWLPGAGVGGRADARVLVKGHRLPALRGVSSEDLRGSMLAALASTAAYMWKLSREWSFNVITAKR